MPTMKETFSLKNNSIELLVPMYNAKRFLPRLHSQVSALTPRFDKIAVWDDASQDGSAELAEQLGFEVQHGKINLGPGGARNQLAWTSSAEWIHFHDIDDEISPDYLKHVLPIQSDDVDVIIHDVLFVNEISREPLIAFRAQPDIETDPIRSLLVHPMGIWSSVIRRELFLRIGGFNEAYRCFEDGDLHLRLALAGGRFRRIPQTLATSLRHDDGASSNMKYCHQCRLAFLERYIDLLPARLMDDLSAEFLKTAYELLTHREFSLAKRAINRCREIGGSFPRTANPIMKIISKFLPDLFALFVQQMARRAAGRLIFRRCD